jgi:hypothetical protein
MPTNINRPPPRPHYNLWLQARHIINAAIATAHHPTLMVFAVVDNTTRDALEYWQLIRNHKYECVWKRSYANEIG